MVIKMALFFNPWFFAPKLDILIKCSLLPNSFLRAMEYHHLCQSLHDPNLKIEPIDKVRLVIY